MTRNAVVGTIAVVVVAAPGTALANLAITSESVSHITTNDATLEALINTEGLQHGAWYQFQVDEFPSEIECPPLELIFPADGCGPGPKNVAGALPIGFVSGGSADQKAILDLANGRVTLQPGTTYSYRVLAAPSAPTVDTIQWVPPPVSGPIQTFTTSPPLVERAEYHNWILSGTLTDKKLEQPIALPEGSTFNGAGEVNTATGSGSITGNIVVPPFAAALSSFGRIQGGLGLTLTQVGPLEGAVAASESAPGDETLTVPIELDLGVTSVDLRGLSIPTNCATAGPVLLNLVDTLTRKELLQTRWSFAGTTTLPSFTCERGVRGVALSHLLTRLLSGPENSYSIDIRAPGA